MCAEPPRRGLERVRRVRFQAPERHRHPRPRRQDLHRLAKRLAAVGDAEALGDVVDPTDSVAAREAVAVESPLLHRKGWVNVGAVARAARDVAGGRAVEGLERRDAARSPHVAMGQSP